MVRPKSLSDNLFKWFVSEVAGWVFQMVLSERQGECVGFEGLKDKFQVLDQFLIPSRSAEIEDTAACLSEG